MLMPTPKRKRKKPTPPPPRKNTKVTGERSEAAFLDRAIQRNFGVAKPWGDSRRYDFILDNGQRLFRIQVKCTESIRARAYETRATYTTGKGRAVYTKKDIDFIAAHVVPLDIWYIIPVEVCTPAPMLRFYPHRKAKKMRLEPYREAWHWILPKPEDEDGNIEIQAAADEKLYVQGAANNDAHVGTDAACPERSRRVRPRNDAHVGTDAFVRPPSEARPKRQNAAAQSDLSFRGQPERQRRQPRNLLFPSTKSTAATDAQLTTYRALCAQTPPTRLPQSAAPRPTPRIKILAPRKGKHILPNPPAQDA